MTTNIEDAIACARRRRRHRSPAMRRYLREAANLSQADLAKIVRCDRSTISRYESGDYAGPKRPDLLERYTEVLDRLARETGQAAEVQS